MPKKTLLQYCEYALTVLNSQYAATQVVKHNDTLGSIREQLIKDFLKAHLPELVHVLSGQIIDANDSYSKQQDIVLVLKGMPRLPFASGSDLIFNEGVVATIEVKTRLDSAGVLRSIADNFASVRRLVAAPHATAQMGLNHNWPLSEVLTAIVTYDGVSFDTLGPALAATASEGQPDLVLDLTKGLFIRNHGLLVMRQGDQPYLRVDNPAEGFQLFLIFLTEITGTLSARGTMWRTYITGPQTPSLEVMGTATCE